VFYVNTLGVKVAWLRANDIMLPSIHSIYFVQEYVLWNAVSVPLLQFARYCSIVQSLSLKCLGRDLDLEVT